MNKQVDNIQFYITTINPKLGDPNGMLHFFLLFTIQQ